MPEYPARSRARERVILHDDPSVDHDEGKAHGVAVRLRQGGRIGDLFWIEENEVGGIPHPDQAAILKIEGAGR